MRALKKYGWMVGLAMAAAVLAPRLEARAEIRAAADWKNTGKNQASLSLQLSKSAGDGEISALQLDLLLSSDGTGAPEKVTFDFDSGLGKMPVREAVYDESLGELTLFLSTDGRTALPLDPETGKTRETRIGTLKAGPGEEILVVIGSAQVVTDGESLRELDSLEGLEFLMSTEETPPDEPEEPTKPAPETKPDPGTRPSRPSAGQGGSSGSSSGSSRSGSVYDSPRKGAAETQGRWQQTGDRWNFRLSSGGLAKNTWVLAKNLWYHIDGSGYMNTGWYQDKDSGTWYLLAPDGHMKTGWQLVNGFWYCMDAETGRMFTGWVLDKGLWYYLQPSGEMVTGWRTIGGRQYYFNPVEPVPVPKTDPATGLPQTDPATGLPVMTTEGQRPYGSMYKDEQTPDGATVNASGERQ